jgi:hypothetical protein
MDCFVAALLAMTVGTTALPHAFILITQGWRRHLMGRYLLLWLLGVPLPILVLIYAFGGLNH